MLREFSSGIKLMFKEFFNKETNKNQRANMWTFSRLVLAFGIPIMAVLGRITSVSLGYILAAIFTIGGALTDFMDGRSARKYNSVSDFGKKLDILADKVFAFMIGISLSITNPLFLFNIFGEAMISFVNIYYHSKCDYIDPSSIFIGKVKQWPLSMTFILGYLSVFLPQLTSITNIFIFTSFIFELFVLKEYIVSNDKQIKNYEKNKKKIKVIDSENDNKKELSMSIQDNINLREEYEKLRNVLIEINNSKGNNDENGHVRIRKK